ncbi:MAG: DUF2859 domain-containing protein [Methyloprofundus sp.]|nr:DUF2859 domain-containing protein [Methyloprofundus sp.]
MIILILVTVPKVVLALPVIANTGQTYPYTSPFAPLDQFINMDIQEVYSQIEALGLNKIKPVSYRQMIEDQTPISTSAKVASFQAYQTPLADAVSVPVCVVGDDQHSHAWLRQNAARLLEANTVCLVASADSIESIVDLSKSAMGVYIQPVSAQSFIELVGLEYYPAVVYQGWVVQ